MKQDHGIVLINALVIVALVSAAAVALQSRAQTEIGFSQLARNATQADLYLDSAVALAQIALLYDDETSDIDTLSEAWARPDYAMPVDHGRAALRLRDMQGLFNLNLLADADDPTDAQATFRRLAETVDLPASTVERIMTHMARTGPVAVMAALEGTPGTAPADWARLHPFVTVLPGRPALNANTAPPEVLAAFLPELSAENIGEVIAERRVRPFADAEGFAAIVRPFLPPRLRDQVNFRRFAARSDWFEARATAELGGDRFSRATLLHRDGDAGQVRRVRHVPFWP